MEQSNSREDPLDQKAEPRPAICECREKSLQRALFSEVKALATTREALKG
jgi:hypothetical protein